jgi:hypothetical protein
MLVSKNTYCTNLDSAPSSSFVPQIMRSCAKNVSFSLSNIFYSRRKSMVFYSPSARETKSSSWNNSHHYPLVE